MGGMTARLTLLLSTLAGCTLYFDDPSTPGECNLTEPAGASLELIAPQRDPDTLLCESFGFDCAPGCDCPALDQPAPTWGTCGGACDDLDEASCMARPECRVARNARCAVDPGCSASDFLGCFPTDQRVDASTDCRNADATTCSRSSACTAYHDPLFCALVGPCPAEFTLCMPEGDDPGTCEGIALCDAGPPPCPADTTPGIANGCYTGACIPLAICPPVR
jgi:hypothetical protein